MSHYDLHNPQHLLECQIKLRGRLDERMSVSWIKATQYAVIDTVLTPLISLYNASFQQFKRLDAETYAITMLELAYFIDLKSKQPVFEFTNPFTQKSGPVPPAIFGPNRVSLTTGGLRPPEHFPFGTLTFEGQLGPAQTDGEDVWIQEDTLVRMESDNPAFGNYIYNELVTYKGHWDDLNNPELVAAPASVAYTTTSNWRPWMQADATPGHILSQGYGKKVAALEDLPADYLAMAEKYDPDVIADPEKLLLAPPPGASGS